MVKRDFIEIIRILVYLFHNILFFICTARVSSNRPNHTTNYDDDERRFDETSVRYDLVKQITNIVLYFDRFTGFQSVYLKVEYEISFQEWRVNVSGEKSENRDKENCRFKTAYQEIHRVAK